MHTRLREEAPNAGDHGREVYHVDRAVEIIDQVKTCLRYTLMQLLDFKVEERKYKKMGYGYRAAHGSKQGSPDSAGY